jgi:FixJ family two-component response regulator
MNDFITKPISHAVLRETLVKHLSLPSVPEDEEDEDETLATSPLSPASLASSAQENRPAPGSNAFGV